MNKKKEFIESLKIEGLSCYIKEFEEVLQEQAKEIFDEVEQFDTSQFLYELDDLKQKYLVKQVKE